MKTFNLDLDLGLDLEGFDEDDETGKSNIKKDKLARVKRHRPAKNVKYERARDLVKGIADIAENEAVYAIVSGNFIAGDIFEAYLDDNNLIAEEMIISTLSYSHDNIDSLRNIQLGNRVEHLALIVSDYFFAHERSDGIKYAIDELTKEDKNFTLAVAGLHTKVTLIKTKCGKYLVFYGSANLRSSGCMEQIVVENNKYLYYFNRQWMIDIINRYSASHKSLRGNKLWLTVVAA